MKRTVLNKVKTAFTFSWAGIILLILFFAPVQIRAQEDGDKQGGKKHRDEQGKGCKNKAGA